MPNYYAFNNKTRKLKKIKPHFKNTSKFTFENIERVKKNGTIKRGVLVEKLRPVRTQEDIDALFPNAVNLNLIKKNRSNTKSPNTLTASPAATNENSPPPLSMKTQSAMWRRRKTRHRKSRK